MKITNEIINEIRNKTDIVSVIANYIPLVQKGKNYFGVCPFHDDHSPSMSVSQEKQIFTCFSCGATGNVFTFVADYEHISFHDAVKILGKKVGYNFQTTSVKNEDKYSGDYNIYELACKFYQNSLNTSLGKTAYEYLEKRKIDKETAKKFRIGLSMKNVSLTDFLINNGITIDKLISLGISNELGTDLFINRIMFPLYDLEGRVVAFSGRIYNTKDTSKYINTKETNIFKKGNILYNYHNAKDILKKNDTIIVMEGFMDVIRCSTVGINNCVATMGTALTKQNALLLKKMAKSIILCFDGDKAGEEATISAINIFKELDLSVKVVRLEEELDPDEYILKYGSDSFKSKIDNPLNSLDFMMDIHRNNKNLTDLMDVSKYIIESLEELTKIDDSVLVDLTLNKLSKEFNINYQVLNDKLSSLIKEKNKTNIKNIIKTTKKSKISKIDLAARTLIYYMTIDSKIINLVDKKVTFFSNEDIRMLAKQIIYYYHKYGIFNIADFISYIQENSTQLNLFKEIINMNLITEYSNDEIEDYINVVNSYPVKRRINELNKKIKEESDPKKQLELLKEKLLLKGVK